MAATSYDEHIFELSVAEPPQSAHLRADRDRGSAPVNNVFTGGFVNVEKNESPEEVVPWYEGHNNEPEYMVALLSQNPVAFGILFSKVAINFGSGLGLYQEDEEGKMKRLKKKDWPEQIRNFYDYNGLYDWAYSMMLDHEITGNCFTHIRFSKGSKVIGKKKWVKEIDRVDPVTVRAVKPGKRSRGEVKEYVMAPKWKDLTTLEGLLKLPKFKRKQFHDDRTLAFVPGESKHPQVMWHGKRDMTGFPIYALPQWYGAKKAGELMGEIPHFHINNLINMFGIRVRVSVNREYIQAMKKKVNPTTKNPYTADEVKEYVQMIVNDYMTSPENVGKPLLDSFYYDHAGKAPVRDFIIETISIDLKDDAYKDIAEMMNSYFTSSFGIDPALADVITTKGMSSGSEKTQGWNVQNAKSQFLRMKVLEVMEFIHDFNEWEAGYYWGFENPWLVTKDISKSGETEGAEPISY